MTPINCEQLLGCELRSGLKWHTQIKMVVEKLGKRLVGLNSLKFILLFNMRNQVTSSMFNSLLIYCLHLCGGYDTNEIKQLQVLQNKSA